MQRHPEVQEARFGSSTTTPTRPSTATPPAASDSVPRSRPDDGAHQTKGVPDEKVSRSDRGSPDGVPRTGRGDRVRPRRPEGRAGQHLLARHGCCVATQRHALEPRRGDPVVRERDDRRRARGRGHHRRPGRRPEGRGLRQPRRGVSAEPREHGRVQARDHEHRAQHRLPHGAQGAPEREDRRRARRGHDHCGRSGGAEAAGERVDVRLQGRRSRGPPSTDDRARKNGHGGK